MEKKTNTPFIIIENIENVEKLIVPGSLEDGQLPKSNAKETQSEDILEKLVVASEQQNRKGNIGLIITIIALIITIIGFIFK